MDQQIKVHVVKADLPLESNESVNSFLSVLRQAIKSHLFQKLKLKDDREKGLHAWVWPVDVFADQVVAEVTQDIKGKPSVRGFWAVGFKRTGSDLTLGDPVPVERRVTYVPKTEVTTKAEITKCAAATGLWANVI